MPSLRARTHPHARTHGEKGPHWHGRALGRPSEDLPHVRKTPPPKHARALTHSHARCPRSARRSHPAPALGKAQSP
eukprot:13410855-Alexandrium_andersonii.AAC.1